MSVTFSTSNVHTLPEVVSTVSQDSKISSEAPQLTVEAIKEQVNRDLERKTGVMAAKEKKESSTSNETLADLVISCESGGRNVCIIDTNGKPSCGIAQFQETTWIWLSGLAGVEGSPLEPEKARQVLVWAIEHGYGPHWTCFNKIMN